MENVKNYKSNPKEIEENLQEKTLKLADYNNGVIICEHKEKDKGIVFAFFGKGQDIAALLTDLELKLPKPIREIRNIMLKKARENSAESESLGAEAPVNCKSYN